MSSLMKLLLPVNKYNKLNTVIRSSGISLKSEEHKVFTTTTVVQRRGEPLDHKVQLQSESADIGVRTNMEDS